MKDLGIQKSSFWLFLILMSAVVNLSIESVALCVRMQKVNKF